LAASSASVTFAPLGGVKSKADAAGRAKSTLVKPTSTTAAPPEAGVSVNFSGMPVFASTATLMAPTVEPDRFGSITSLYASRPATWAVPSTVTDVVSSAAFKASSANSFGVAGTSPFRSPFRSPRAAESSAVEWWTSLDALS
jgi:hypothetical protein